VYWAGAVIEFQLRLSRTCGIAHWCNINHTSFYLASSAEERCPESGNLVQTEIIMSLKESFAVTGEALLKKVQELIQEGNVRKISIHDKSGKELASFPLNVGVVGALLAPVLAAIGALAALIGECTITVERDEPVKKTDQPG
jgi:hypothetical protein